MMLFLVLLTLAPQVVIAAPGNKLVCSSALKTTATPSFLGRLKDRISSMTKARSKSRVGAEHRLRLESAENEDADLSPSQGRLKGEWNRLSQMESTDRQALKKQAARVIRESMAVLSEKGVQYELDPENPLILLIAVPDQKRSDTHPLNRLAYSIARNLRVKINGKAVGLPLRVEINPFMLKTHNAGALFDENLSRLTLANDNVMHARIDDMVVHEIRHAYSFYALANGFDHFFTGFVTYSDKLPPIHETYPHAFSVDELPAYVKQITTQLRMAKRDSSVIDSALDFTKTGLLLTQAMNRPAVSSGLLFQLQALRQNPKDWTPPRWTEIKIDGEAVMVWMYNHTASGARIYFYESAMLELQYAEVPIKITHAVIEHGDYKIDMNTLVPLSPDNMKPLLTKVERKILGLMKRGEKIEKGLQETLAALEKPESPDLAKALVAIQSAMSVIDIKNFAEDLDISN